MAEASSPSPDPPSRGPVPFKTTFLKTALVIANLTAVVIFVPEFVRFLTELGPLGVREALTRFAIAFTVKAVLTVVFNCFAVALPIAGAIHYVRYLARPR